MTLTKGKSKLHQELTLSPFLFTVVMDRLTDGIRHESLWTTMLLTL